MRIALLITTHKRPEITKICFKGVERIIKQFSRSGLELMPFIAISDEENQEIADEHGFDSIHTQNEELGKKHNTLLKHARKYRPDYYMQLGSDDLITTTGASMLITEIMRLGKFFGFDSLILWHKESGKLRKHSGRMVFGAGRCVHSSIIETCLAEYGDVWNDNRMRGLDGNSASNISRAYVKRYGRPLTAIRLNCQIPAIIDIKSDVNINPFESIPGTNYEFTQLCPEMTK